MDFFILLRKKLISPINISIERTTEDQSSFDENILYIIGQGTHTTFEEITTLYYSAVILGDPIYHEPKEQAWNLLAKRDFSSFIKNVDGFYFIIYFDTSKNEVLISNSLFGIIPVFYTDNHRNVLVSSSFDLIVNSTETSGFTHDKQYYLEKSLFNYPFLDRTPIEQIKTLPSNCLLKLSRGLSFHKHTYISDYFVGQPKPWRHSLDHLSDIFIKQAKAFIPNERFCATLTGGLDGRTLVALSSSQASNFFTYSYGTEETADIKIPRGISKDLGIEYRPFIIDEEYSEKQFWNYGLKFQRATAGLGNINRSHYAYSAENILLDTRYLVSGNFGSEIIRSMKIPGVMTSHMLFNIFKTEKISEIREAILNYPGKRYISKVALNNGLESLLESINSFLYNLPEGLTTNQRFYIYLFEQVFPKYFGPEISFQRKHFNHRAPFLNFRFLEELLKTDVAGANSDYLETNPFKRYHGQVLYSHIIKKTNPNLLNFLLDKNYKPAHFLSTFGPINIGLGFIIKKLKNTNPKDSPRFSHNNMALNFSNYKEVFINDMIFDVQFFQQQLMQRNNLDSLDFINNLSAILYNNKLNNDISQ